MDDAQPTTELVWHVEYDGREADVPAWVVRLLLFSMLVKDDARRWLNVEAIRNG